MVQRPDNCPRCRRCHVGALMFATRGFMVLFLSDVETEMTENEIWFRDTHQIPLIRPRTASLSAFLGEANAI